MTLRQKDAIARAMKSRLHFSVKDADKGLVEAVFSRFNVIDYDYDFTLPGAFEDGTKVLISAYGHKSWMGAKPVGTGTIHSDEEKAWLEGQFFLDTIDGLDTFKTIKGTGDLQEWSYGYEVLETGEVTEEMRQRGVWRVIKKARVYEVCPVMIGSGVDTETVDIKSREAEPPKVIEPTPEEIAAVALNAELSSKARAEFTRFMKTRVRLVIGRDAAA